MRQEITRSHKGWALDAVVLDNDVTKLMKEDITSPPSEGKTGARPAHNEQQRVFTLFPLLLLHHQTYFHIHCNFSDD